MSAAAAPATTQLFHEGTEFWAQLVQECKRQTDSINACVAEHGLSSDDLVKWSPGRDIDMARIGYPSTAVKATIDFRSWGPTISGTITGRQDHELNFAPEGFEILIAKDLDGAVVAILGEGRSLSPKELAAYLTQHFRRCFPEISLPYRTASA